jgi:DNA repair exonuclease SbcCD nuclease subunit
VACGDVFEANQLDRQVVARALEAMADVPVPVYLLPGNHDPVDAGSIFTSPAFAADVPPNVTVLAEPGVFDAGDGVQLVAAPWTSKRPLADLLAAVLAGLGPAPPGTTRVAVGHGVVDALSPDRDNPAVLSLRALEQAVATGVVHYVALGDRHSTTAVGSTGRVWYSGAPEATDFDEVDPGNALVVDAGPDGCSVTPHRVGRWRFVRRPFSVDSADDVDALAGWLAALPDKAESVVRVHLSGTLSLADQARLEAALDDATPRFAALDVWGTTVAMPDEADLSELGLTGFAQRALAELEADATEEDAEAAGALSLLYRLAKEGAA